MPVSNPERDNAEQLTSLTSEHRVIKERLRQLASPVSSAERVERAQLTRRRMKTADQLLQLQHH